jgi:hypothetical protein
MTVKCYMLETKAKLVTVRKLYCFKRNKKFNRYSATNTNIG